MFKILFLIICFHQTLAAPHRVFLLSPTRENWSDAFNACQRQGYQLVSIETEHKAIEVEKFISNHNTNGKYNTWQNQIWTSGNRNNNNESFVWKSIGQPVTYTKWQIGEPSGHDFNSLEHENCLGLLHVNNTFIEWNDVACSLDYYYLCEKLVHIEHQTTEESYEYESEELTTTKSEIILNTSSVKPIVNKIEGSGTMRLQNIQCGFIVLTFFMLYFYF